MTVLINKHESFVSQISPVSRYYELWWNADTSCRDTLCLIIPW